MPFLIFSALRLALIAVVAVVLYLVGMRGWLLGVVAVVVALCLSYLVLGPQRERAANYMTQRRKAAREGTERSEDDDLEDAQIEATTASVGPSSEPVADAGAADQGTQDAQGAPSASPSPSSTPNASS